MHPVYGYKCYTRPAIHVLYKQFAHGREIVVDEERPGRRVVVTTDAKIVSVDSLMRSNRAKCLNEFGQNTLKNETLMFDV